MEMLVLVEFIAKVVLAVFADCDCLLEKIDGFSLMVRQLSDDVDTVGGDADADVHDIGILRDDV